MNAMGRTHDGYERRASDLVDEFIERNQVPGELLSEVRALHRAGNSGEALQLILEARKESWEGDRTDVRRSSGRE